MELSKHLNTKWNNFSEYKKLLIEYKDGFDTFLDSLTDSELNELMFDLHWQGRPNQQLPTGDWLNWIILSGRGFGKTFVGAGVIPIWAKSCPQIALVGADIGEVRDVMIDGPSGLLARANPDFKPTFNKVLCQLTYPNGSKVWGYSGDKPDSLRGPNNGKAWVDELFKFRYQKELWDELMMTMRLGDHPQTLITSTPRPTQLCKDLVADKRTVITRGSTFDNYELAKPFLEVTVQKYMGTRRGRQELYGEILDDNPDALWKVADIEKGRVRQLDDQGKAWLLQMDRIVVGVDPAMKAKEDSDDTGIIVAGRKGDDGYVFSDKTCQKSPAEWAAEVVKAYRDHKADKVIGEINQGGDLVEATLRNVNRFIAFEGVHATRGKAIRAEPIAALYEQGRIHHVGEFVELEGELLNFNPTLGRNQKSPNRLDALCWAMANLFGDSFGEPQLLFI